MRSKKSILVFGIIAIFLISSVISAIGNNDIKNGEDSIFMDNLNYQDGRNISKLEWFSPNGKLPGMYDDYISWHPPTTAKFSENNYYKDTSIFGNKISILVDTNIYNKIYEKLYQYINDLKSEGYSTFVQTVNGGGPSEIKTWVKERYNSGTIGIVFIGDITAAWAEVSDSVFPCDLFYMDVDGNWEDRDKDGVYEIHTSGSGDLGPELFIGRIYAYTLDYDTEVNLINLYLEKAHEYRLGQISQPWRALEYVEEDWFDMDVNLKDIYLQNVTRHDHGFLTRAADYLNQINLGQHFVQVCAHSSSSGHFFGTRPTESSAYAHTYIYGPTNRSAKLLLGSDDGIKVWMNGENVLTKDVYISWTQDNFIIDVDLKQGWNQLLCKISQGGGDYMFSAKITDSDYKSYNDLKYQINNPFFYVEESDYIRSWLLNGFHQDADYNFYNYLSKNYLGQNEANINPYEGEEMGGKTWTRYNSGNPFINMGEHCGNKDFGVCYAFSRVYADSSKSCQLWAGYDDGMRVWLNGQEIIFENEWGDFEPDTKKINVTLNAGENRLLVKISEWMGEHGFSLKLCKSDGSPVDGIIYEPESTPITHIGTWLINGPYLNIDENTRLTTDYLNGENQTMPSQNTTAPEGDWDRGIGNGCPFNLGQFFDNGDWVLSEDIQNLDPPVLFYNLFACGSGRFTDKNYLAGSYIFNTTYGLISIASSKSGSMLNFGDFTKPLSQGSTVGEAFKIWFNKQAPFLQWEKEWYYGMTLFGDPTLVVRELSNYPPFKPCIIGHSSGLPKNNYNYTFVTTDREGDDIYYWIEWGDGNVEGNDWIGPYSSGEELTIAHNWTQKGKYSIRVKAKDSQDAESAWKTLDVKMPKNMLGEIPIILKMLIRLIKMLPMFSSMFNV